MVCGFFEGNILKEKSHNCLKLLFLKRTFQLISKNLRVFDGYVAYKYLVSTPKLGPPFIAKLNVTEKILWFEKSFVFLTRKNSALLIILL